jgi:hypothetical protein
MCGLLSFTVKRYHALRVTLKLIFDCMLDESRFDFFVFELVLKLLDVLGFQSLKIKLNILHLDLRNHNFFKAAIRVKVESRVAFMKL